MSEHPATIIETSWPIPDGADDATVQDLLQPAVQSWFDEVARQYCRALDDPMATLIVLRSRSDHAPSLNPREWHIAGSVTNWPVAGYQLTYRRGPLALTADSPTLKGAAQLLVERVAESPTPADWTGPNGAFPRLLGPWLLDDRRVAGKTYRNKQVGGTLRIDVIPIG